VRFISGFHFSKFSSGFISHFRISFLKRAGILPKQPSNVNNVILGLNTAFPNVVIVEFWERLQDGVNEDRWVEVKLYGRNT